MPAPPAMMEKKESLAEIQARLQAANEERGANQTEVTTLQQEEEVSISGSNARLMVMQKLSRKSLVRFAKTCFLLCPISSPFLTDASSSSPAPPPPPPTVPPPPPSF